MLDLVSTIKQYRIQKGMRQEELCEGICSVSQLSKIENGKAKAKPEQLQAFAERLGLGRELLLSPDALREELEQNLKLAMKLNNAGHHEKARTLVVQVMQQSHEQGYEDLYIEAAFQVTRCMESLGEWEEAAKLLIELLSSGRELEPRRLLELYGQLGLTYQYMGKKGEAYKYYAQEERYIDLIEEDDPHLLRVYYRYSAHQSELRHHEEAYKFARKAYELAKANQMHIWRLRAANLVALELSWLRRDREGRYGLLKAILQEAEENSLLYEAGVSANNLGTLYLHDEDFAHARQCQELCIHYWSCIPNIYASPYLCEPYFELAVISVRTDMYEQAETYIAHIRELLQTRDGGYLYQARIEMVQAEMAGRQNRSADRAVHLRAALAIYDRHQVYWEARITAEELAVTFEQAGDATEALEMYRQAIGYQQKFEAARSTKIGQN